jgi:hypothetical protein
VFIALDLATDDVGRHSTRRERSHRQDALERDGLASDAAALASRQAMGNVSLAIEDVREVWVSRAVDQLLQDIRMAFRGLRKNPCRPCTAACSRRPMTRPLPRIARLRSSAIDSGASGLPAPMT